jgi:hypothetical protein
MNAILLLAVATVGQSGWQVDVTAAVGPLAQMSGTSVTVVRSTANPNGGSGTIYMTLANGEVAPRGHVEVWIDGPVYEVRVSANTLQAKGTARHGGALMTPFTLGGGSFKGTQGAYRATVTPIP